MITGIKLILREREGKKEMPLKMGCYVLYERRFINGHTIKDGSLRFIYECYFICTELIWIRILPVAFDGAKGSVADGNE